MNSRSPGVSCIKLFDIVTHECVLNIFLLVSPGVASVYSIKIHFTMKIRFLTQNPIYASWSSMQSLRGGSKIFLYERAPKNTLVHQVTTSKKSARYYFVEFLWQKWGKYTQNSSLRPSIKHIKYVVTPSWVSKICCWYFFWKERILKL